MQIKESTAVTFNSKYQQHRQYNGQQCIVVGQVPADSYDAAECGPIYLVRFPDGQQIEAWPEEIKAEPFTRADYMSATPPRMQDHRRFYAQMVTPEVIKLVRDYIGEGRIAHSTDEHFNDIPLIAWDRLDPMVRALCADKLRSLGDFWSLSATVCIAKEAARQIKGQ